MTTAPTPSTARPATRFHARTITATGYSRTGLTHLVCGTHEGANAHLSLPLEQVVAAKVGYRGYGTDLRLNIRVPHNQTPERFTAVAQKAASAVSDAHGLSGDVRIQLRLSFTNPDLRLDAAVATATIRGFADAADLPMDDSQVQALLTELGYREGTHYPVATFVSDEGQALHEPWDVHQTFRAVVVTQAEHTCAGGEEIVLPATDVEPLEWLQGVAGGGTSVAREIVEMVTEDVDGVLAVLGGGTETSPIVVLFADEGATLRQAQTLAHRLRTYVPEPGSGVEVPDWRVQIARTAHC